MRIRKTLVLGIAVLAVAAASPAEARGGGGHHSGGGGHFHHRPHFFATTVFIAAPLYFGSRYYPAPAYYAPPAPVTYIEQAPEPSAQAYWYYCEQSRAYYPQVQNCSAGWQRVAPQPPPDPN